MAVGGKRPGAGRPPGAKNKLTRQIEQAGQQAAVVAMAFPEAFQGDAHALLVMVYKDPAQPIELRLEAAKAAIRFEKPALAAVDHTTLGERVKFAISAEPIGLDEWVAKHGVQH